MEFSLMKARIASQDHPVAVSTATESIQQLLKRAQENDVSCLPELRTLLHEKPELWHEIGDVCAHATRSTLRLYSGTNLLLQEAVFKKLAQLKTDLGGPSPSTVEKLIIDRIAVSWLQVHQLDFQAAADVVSQISPAGVWAQKKIDSAHKRYLLAIKQLVTVRKLLRPDLPAIQIGEFLSGAGAYRITLAGKSASDPSDSELN
jgi:hypothetical protein